MPAIAVYAQSPKNTRFMPAPNGPALSCRPPVNVPRSNRTAARGITPGRAAGRLESLAGSGAAAGHALLDGARPDDGSGANYRGPSEAIGDHAKHTRGE